MLFERKPRNPDAIVEAMVKSIKADNWVSILIEGELIMKKVKQVLTIVLALCMMINMTLISALAADEGTGDIELFAENSTKVEPQILSLAVVNNIATVGYQYDETDAFIGVAIYDKATEKMLAYNSADLSADDNGTISIALDGAIPDEFNAKAFLLQKETMFPLCQTLELAEVKPKIECTELDSKHITTEVLTIETANGDELDYEVQYVDNELIVVGAENTTREQIGKFVGAYGGSIVGYIQVLGYYQVELSTPTNKVDDLNQIIYEWTKSPLIETAWVNTVSEYEVDSSILFPKDSWGGSSWSEDYPSGNNWWFEAIYAASAQQLLIDKYGSRTAVPRVAVGVMDGCFDINHPDLRFTSISSFQNGVDIANVAALAQSTSSSSEYASYVHGTHVAGIISATGNNGRGITGVALNTELHGYELLERNGKLGSELKKGWTTSIFNWMTSAGYLIEKGCRVINYSAGYNTSDSNKQMQTALSDGAKMGKVLQGYLDKGYDFVIVTSAGNGESANTDAQYNNSFAAVSPVDYPEVYNRVIVVGGASEYYGRLGSFAFVSSWNSGSRIDVIAPGLNIYSTVPANNTFSGGSQYFLASGTSMASPCVAGVAALVFEANPSLTGSQVKRTICETANIPVSGMDTFGNVFNMVNAEYAVSKALNKSYSVSGGSDNGIQWTLSSDGVLTISGMARIVPISSVSDVLSNNGFYYEQSSDTTASYYPWDRHQNKIKAIEISDSVIGISKQSFCYAGDTIKSAIIPRSVTEIGAYAIGFSWPDEDSVTDGFVIYGYSSTMAEKYAMDNNIKFVNLDPFSEIIGTNAGDFIVKGGNAGVDWSFYDNKLSILSSTPMQIQNANQQIPTKQIIYIEGGVDANITLAGIYIDASERDTPAFEIADSSTGDVTITLAKGSSNTLIGGDGAGIQKEGFGDDVGTLTIMGSGELIATGGEGGAGVGGNSCFSDVRNITITGYAKVTATAGSGHSAGIGSGTESRASGITISGFADVSAVGATGGAGIGAGATGNASNITICDSARVTAVGGKGGAGIGGGGAYSFTYGGYGGSGTYIVISGSAEVVAIGGDGGYYLGSNGYGSTFYGGGGAGIGGGGSGGSASNINIDEATEVVALGGSNGENRGNAPNIGSGGSRWWS